MEAELSVLFAEIPDERIERIDRRRQLFARAQLCQIAAVHQRGKCAARAGNGVDIHAAVAVHHALEQRAFIQIVRDGHHIFRMLVRKGVIRRLDALNVVAVDNAQTLGRHFIQRHITPDNAVVAAEDVPVAHHHRHAAGIGFQRHVARTPPACRSRRR